MERKNLNRLAVAAGLALLANLPQPARAQNCEAPIDLSAWNREDLRQLYEGYCQSGFFVPGLVTETTWRSPMPPHATGNAVWYNPGVMQQVADNRGIDLSGYMGGVSLMTPAHDGEQLWFRRNGVWEGPYLIIDTVRREHALRAIDYVGEIAEVSFETADQWGWIVRSEDGSLDRLNSRKIDQVEICIGSNPADCEGTEPVNYPSWWRANARFVNPNGGPSLTYAEIPSLPATSAVELPIPTRAGPDVTKGTKTLTRH